MAEVSVFQKKKMEVEAEGLDKDAWMVTFGDLLQLLITFFILLISMSSMDQKVFKEMFSMFSGGTGVLSLSSGIKVAPPSIKPIVIAPMMDAEDFLKFLKAEALDLDMPMPPTKETSRIVDSLLVQGVEIVKRGRSFALILENEALFEPGSAKLSEAFTPVLDEIGSVLSLSRSKITVEGHADDQPFKSSVLPSNWELSAARATAIMIYLANNSNINYGRLEAKGYSYHRPRVKNISDYYRKLNRRVEIVIKQFTEESF